MCSSDLFSCAFLYFLPVSLRFMFRNQQVEGIGFVISQSAGVHIRLIIHFLEGFLDLVACSFRHVRTVVQNSVYGSNGYASSLGNILDSDFFGHCFLALRVWLPRVYLLYKEPLLGATIDKTSQVLPSCAQTTISIKQFCCVRPQVRILPQIYNNFLNCAKTQQLFCTKNKKKCDFISLFEKLWLFLPSKLNDN